MNHRRRRPRRKIDLEDKKGTPRTKRTPRATEKAEVRRLAERER